MLYLILSNLGPIIFICIAVALLFFGLALVKGKPYAAAFSISVLLTLFLFGLCVLGDQEFESFNYSAIVYSEPIEFVKEDKTHKQIIYGHDGEQYIEKGKDCEIILISDNLLSDGVSASVFPSMPYCQYEKTETYKVVKYLGLVARSKPKITYKYRFYVLKSYFDNTDFDWSLLVESTLPE